MAALLREAHLAGGHDLPELARRHVAGFGGSDAWLLLADLQQTVLVPFVDASGPRQDESFTTLAIDGTIAGRVFQRLEVLAQRRGPHGVTVMLPLLDGSERLGVMAVKIDDPTGGPDAVLDDEALLDQLRCFASLFAELVVTNTLYGDSIVRCRRQGQMGLAAELQWSLLPPLTFACRAVTVAAALEPAYEVAGDAIDYAVGAGIARVAVLDGMGHGLTSAHLAAISIAAYRQARRLDHSLVDTCLAVDDALLTVFNGSKFTTAVLGELDTTTGGFSWVNAGHPEPLLLRSGRLVKSLSTVTRPPLGVDLAPLRVPREPTIGHEQLEPGDCLLLYTDGVIEARSPNGEFFGENRLLDLITSTLADGVIPPETMRRTVRALLEHQQGRLSDDATLMLIQWPSADTRTFSS